MNEVTVDDVRAAAERIAGHVERTPSARSETLSDLLGCGVVLKFENLQFTAAFKERGALNKLLTLTPDERACGVVAMSAGNHAQAVARHATRLGIAATIVMPAHTPFIKVQRTEVLGAVVRLHGADLAEATEEAQRLAAEGRTFVHPYDDPAVVAGQGTVALELLEQVPGLQAVVAPVGGGGLLSGIALAVRGVAPECRVFAGEPAGADDAARSKASGARIAHQTPDTIADGLLTTLGQNTWPVVRDLVEEIVVVDDDAIRAALRLVYERLKLVVEPSAVVPLAAVLSDRFRALEGVERVGIVLSGGNLDLSRLPELLG